MRTELLLATLILGTAACGDPPAPAGGSAAASGSGAKPPVSAAKTATATATATMTASAAPATSAAPDAKAVVGTCSHKVDATCKEYLAKLPADVETSCAGKDKKGELVKDSKPCTHEDALGTCELKVGDLEEAHHYYKKAGATEAALKKSCEDAKGTWVPEAAAAGSASAAAGSAAPAAGSAAPKK